MPSRYTLVCTVCSAGWEDDQPTGQCQSCGREAECRDRYTTTFLSTGNTPTCPRDSQP